MASRGNGGERAGSVWAATALLVAVFLLVGPGTAHSQTPPTLAESLDQESRTFSTGGSAPWFGQRDLTRDGVDAAQSGDIDDYQVSWVETATTVDDGFISFRWRVSSEEFYDTLRFFIDGVQQGSISGEVGWHLTAFPVTQGSRVFRWEYRKDGSESERGDAAWVDQVAFTPEQPPAGLAVTSLPDAGVTVDVSPADLGGEGGGATPLERSYTRGQTVTLTAPATSPQGADFSYWTGCDVPYLEDTVCTVQMAGSRSVTARYRPSLSEALDQRDWAFARSGDVLWTGSDTGADAVDSAYAEVSEGQTAVLETTGTFPTAGYLFFWQRGWYGGGTLEFYLDGSLAATFDSTGYPTWERSGFAVTAGEHALRWVARADAGQMAAVFLDGLAFSETAPNTYLSVAAWNVIVSIAVDTPDVAGESDGTPPFMREYPLGTKVRLTAPLTTDAGQVFTGWAGCDGAGSPENPVCEVSLYASRAVVPGYVITLSAALDQPGWDFIASGEEAWGGESWGHDGVDAASAYVWDARTAVVQTEQTFAAGGYLTFWWGASAFGTSSLEFYLDDLEVPHAEFGGVEDAWEQRGLPVGAGTHVLRWVARSALGGDLLAGLDEIVFTETPPLMQRTVQSSAAGVPIAADTSGAGGTTPYAIEFPLGTALRLTAPPLSGELEFTEWQGCDATEGQRNEVCVVTMNSSSPVLAGYAVPLAVAVDQPGWNFVRSGEVDWGGGPGGHDGVDSGSATTVDGEAAVIEVVRTFDVPGYVAFWWTGSAPGGEVAFYLDDPGSPAWTLGWWGWQQQSFAVGAGTHTLRWVLRAGPGGQGQAILDEITFRPNRAPVASGAVARTHQGLPTWVELAAVDADGDPLSYRIVTSPAHGSLSGTAPSLLYTPEAGYIGPDSFTFAANDGLGDGNVATVSLTVLTSFGGVFFDDFTDGAAPADWQVLSGTWSSSGRVYTASSLRKNNLSQVLQFGPANAPLGAAMLQARVKLTASASRGGPNGMLVFAYQDPAHYRWVKVTPSRILIGQTGSFGGVAGGVKRKVAKAQALNRFALYTVKILADGWVRVYKGTSGKPVLAYQFLSGGAPSVVPGGVGLAAAKAKTVFDNVSVFDDPGP